MSTSDNIEDVRRFNQAISGLDQVTAATTYLELALACGWSDDEALSPKHWIQELIAFMQKEVDSLTDNEQLKELGIHYDISFFKKYQQRNIDTLKGKLNELNKKT